MVKVGKSPELVDREEMIRKYLESNPWSAVVAVSDMLGRDVTRDATYQTLSTMVEDGSVIVSKINRKNVYALPGTSEETTKDEGVDTSETIPTPEKVKRVKPEYKDLPESKDVVEEMLGTVKVEEVNPEEIIISCLLCDANEILIKPKKSVTVSFSGQKEILKGYGSLPVEVQEATDMTMIPGDETYQLDIKVEV